MEITVKGVITDILPRQDKTDREGKPYSTQEIAVETIGEKYKRTVAFTVLSTESRPRLKDFAQYLVTGNTVFASCYVNSRRSSDGTRYFTELNCYAMGFHHPQQ